MISKIKSNWYFDAWIVVIVSPLILRIFGALVEMISGISYFSEVSSNLIHDLNIILNGFYIYICVICIALSLGLYIYERYKS